MGSKGWVARYSCVEGRACILSGFEGLVYHPVSPSFLPVCGTHLLDEDESPLVVDGVLSALGVLDLLLQLLQCRTLGRRLRLLPPQLVIPARQQRTYKSSVINHFHTGKKRW